VKITENTAIFLKISNGHQLRKIGPMYSPEYG